MHNFGILLITSIIIACNKNDAPASSGPREVVTVVAENRDLEAYRSFPASLEGRVSNEVRAKIQGYITEVLVDEGQVVHQGQPLFRLETNILDESASAARAGVGAAQSGVSAAEANVSAARAAVNAAQVEVDKLRPLVERNIISNVQLETAMANHAQAQAQLSQALAARQQAQAGVSQARANLQGVQENINFAVIRAPISGIVGRINLRTGSLVGPGDQTPITSVSDTKEIFAYFSMNEREYFDFLEDTEGESLSQKLNHLSEVQLVLANGAVYPHEGTIEAVTGQINPQTGTIQFRVRIPNPQSFLSHGNTGTIRIPVPHPSSLIVPESATYEQQGMVYVYKVVQDTARNQVIQVVDRVDNMVIVSSGISRGDTVVAQGVAAIRPGTAVKKVHKSTDEILKQLQPVFTD